VSKPGDKNQIRTAVRDHYAQAITRKSGCCSPRPVELTAESADKFVQLSGYTKEDLARVPENTTSFGCGNPVSFADVKPGQTVLDLGSGAGMDLILAAGRVGPEGRVIGLDMTPEMIEVCRKNLATAGITNAEVRQGVMEEMPVADQETDWIISNCVINLSPEKEKVFAEAYRVLKPGGRMLISDIVTQDLPDDLRGDMSAWVGCLAGAEEEADYLRLMEDAGFVDVKIVEKLVYDRAALGALAGDASGCCSGNETGEISADMVEKFADRVASVRVSARKAE